MHTSSDMSDAQIIAKEQTVYRARLRAALAIVAVTMVVALAAFAAGKMGWLNTALPAGWAFAIPVIFLLPALVLLWFFRAPQEAGRTSVLRRQIDTYQTRNNLSSAILLLSALLIAYRLSVEAHPNFALMAIFVFMIVMFGAMVCFGPGYLRKDYRDALDDELLRAMRGRAARVGYITMIVLAAAAYPLIALYPALALTIWPFLLLAGVAVPTAYFVFLHWTASGDE